METVCPRCDSTIIVDDASPHEIRCGECGSTFVRSPDTITFVPGGSEYQTTFVSPQSDRTASIDSELGDYELIEEIARGGMGIVWKARQKKLNRMVALKLIQTGEFADTHEVNRFRSEAQAAAQLDHPCIVPVYEVGEQNGQHFFSMALVEGGSLSDKVKDEGPLPPKAAAELIKTVAEAVQFGHDKGIIHRDIKPHNILLDQSGSPRITDFGLARHGDSEQTVIGQVMGTPSYMPPEQAQGRQQEIGVTSDVYSLGATLYHLMTGRPPFQAASPTATLRQVIETDAVEPRRLNPDIPAELETICLKCLKKEPPDRYQTAAQLADDLRRYLSGEPISAKPDGFFDRVLRTISKSRLREELNVWGNYLYVIALIVAVSHVILHTLYRQQPPIQWIIATDCVQFSLIAVVVLYGNRIRDASAIGEEHRLWLLVVGYLMGCALLRLTAYSQVSSLAEVYHAREYPAFCILTAELFFMLGLFQWGMFFVFSALFAVVAVCATFLTPESAVLLFGFSWAATLFSFGRHLRHLGKE